MKEKRRNDNVTDLNTVEKLIWRLVLLLKWICLKFLFLLECYLQIKLVLSSLNNNLSALFSIYFTTNLSVSVSQTTPLFSAKDVTKLQSQKQKMLLLFKNCFQVQFE